MGDEEITPGPPPAGALAGEEAAVRGELLQRLASVPFPASRAELVDAVGNGRLGARLRLLDPDDRYVSAEAVLTALAEATGAHIPPADPGGNQGV